MDRFLNDMAASLAMAGFPETECPLAARSAISQIETTLISPALFAAYLDALRGCYRQAIHQALGSNAERLLIAPIPAYVEAALPDLLAEFPDAVLADNFKAGQFFAGRRCVTLDEALVDGAQFDGYFLATVDQRVGRMFRRRFPLEKTIAAADIVGFDPSCIALVEQPAFEQFRTSISGAHRPLLVLSAYLDTTFVPTLEALKQHGYDVFVVTRSRFVDTNGRNIFNPAEFGEGRCYVARFDEMLSLLRGLGRCPVLFNYARFLNADWDLHNTIPLFAYCVAALRAASGPKILHLYDAYQVSLTGFEVEGPSFALYESLLKEADGIIANFGVTPVIQELAGPGKPIIGFLRYGPEVEVLPEPDPGPFSIVIITDMVGEWSDPTRMTGDAVRELLRQEIHVHYYSVTAAVRRFQAMLPERESAFFHRHDTIGRQQDLVREISRYHAGWFVPDMSCCEEPSDVYRTPLARSLASCFVPTTVATAGILYGCAGLPSFFIKGHYTARLFTEGTAIEIGFEDVSQLSNLIKERDWSALRRRAFAARSAFSTSTHIPRLNEWLSLFSDIAEPYA